MPKSKETVARQPPGGAISLRSALPDVKAPETVIVSISTLRAFGF